MLELTSASSFVEFPSSAGSFASSDYYFYDGFNSQIAGLCAEICCSRLLTLFASCEQWREYGERFAGLLQGHQDWEDSDTPGGR
jgi:hypothetical protein